MSTAEDWDERGVAAQIGDPDLVRVAALAQSEPATPELVAALSRHLSRPGSDVELRQKQTEALRDLFDLRGVVGSMPTGEGKCWGRGTPMLRFDGKIVAVEDVAMGDLLMGPDSYPRLVMSTTRGAGPLYRVIPIKGDPWVCNDAHILTLVNTWRGDVVDVSVGDYLHRWTATRRHEYKLFQPQSITFVSAPPLPVDPYFLGVWYGDGTKALAGVSITKPDPEIVALCHATAAAWGLCVRTTTNPERCPTHHLVGKQRHNPLLDTMRSICGDARSIPHEYLTASVADRRALLAGLLDSDGFLDHGNYEIVQRERGIADGIAFVARSLGFRVTESDKIVSGARYRRLKVIGDSTALPMRIPRKIAAPREQIKNPLRTGFRLEPIGVGEYFGFTLSGDGRCLLGDFTVTHNTLVTLLAPTLLAAERPVLILPANCRDKTRTEYAEYLADGWNVRLPKMLSYTELSLKSREHKLLELQPDLVMLDEADEARNIDGTGFGRRIRRALATLNPRPRVAILSATLIGDALLDYWELIAWALQERAPVPLTKPVAERWAAATDRTLRGELHRKDPGALELLPGGFHHHLRTRRGMVCGRGEVCPAAIEITTWVPPISASLRQVINACTVTSKRPDGERVTEWELPDLLCCLAQGFYQVWDPMPPKWWLEPRRAYLDRERAILDAQIEGFDTAAQIRDALDARPKRRIPELGDEADDVRAALAAWREVKDRFVPNSVPVWLTGEIMDAVATKAAATPGQIVWVKHRAPGHELQRRGLPYFGADTQPHQHTPGAPMVCSIQAHARGKNLQAWWRALVLHPMANSRKWEQLISREHRPGQKASTIYVEVIAGVEYHGAVLERVLKQAQADSDASGVPHKMVLAKWT